MICALDAAGTAIRFIWAASGGSFVVEGTAQSPCGTRTARSPV
jgi:hypothetical protein